MSSEKTKYNKTELHVYDTLERNISHRDFYAHLLRWNHVLKIAEIGMNILDVGCGSAGLFETLYRNRYRPATYLGVDIRESVIKMNRDKWDNKGALFVTMDVVSDKLPEYEKTWDMICSFELLEHVGKHNVPSVLDNIKNVANSKTKILISTPCYNGIDYADNHVIDGKVAELTYDELHDLLTARFNIKNVWGTFASIKDYKNQLDSLYNGELRHIYEKLHEYYDSNVLSVIMAPIFPRHSRNCLWEVTL